MNRSPITKAVIPAAGLGTRFLPATKAQPKEMLPIVDTPTIQFVVEEAVRSGIRDLLFITGKEKRSIEDHFDRNPELERRLNNGAQAGMLAHLEDLIGQVQIHYVRQGEQRGLGHAILQARWHIDNEPFAVLLGDTIVSSSTPCTRQLIEAHARTGASVVGLEKIDRSKADRYGIIRGEPAGDERTYLLSDLVEKPAPAEAPSDLAIGGRYILTPDIFNLLEQTPAGKNNEIQLTDALRAQAARQPVYGYHFEGKRYDIGNRLDYLITQIDFALQRPDVSDGLKKYIKELAAGL